MSDPLDRLSELSPEARSRIEDLVNTEIEAELRASPGLADAEFSRGVFFSRSRGSVDVVQEQLLSRAAEMDERTFGQFADRLAKLKGIKESPKGGD